MTCVFVCEYIFTCFSYSNRNWKELEFHGLINWFPIRANRLHSYPVILKYLSCQLSFSTEKVIVSSGSTNDHEWVMNCDGKVQETSFKWYGSVSFTKSNDSIKKDLFSLQDQPARLQISICHLYILLNLEQQFLSHSIICNFSLLMIKFRSNFPCQPKLEQNCTGRTLQNITRGNPTWNRWIVPLDLLSLFVINIILWIAIIYLLWFGVLDVYLLIFFCNPSKK